MTDQQVQTRESSPNDALGFVIRVDENKCVNCHGCIAACPTKYGNDGSGEVVRLNPDFCIGCGACLRACTHEARYVVDDCRAFLEHTGRGGKCIAIVAPSVAANFPQQYLHLNGWLKCVGVEAVFDVSFGAELAARSYVEYLRVNNGKTLIAQPCPAIVTYIETFQPELLPYLAPVDSPMGHLLKWIRQRHPEYDRHKIVALSPCPAKKREFDETGFDVFNVGLTSLGAFFRENKIFLDKYKPEPYANPAPERAVLFSSPGGLLETVRRSLPDVAAQTRKIEGTDTVYEYLRKLPDVLKSGCAPLLIDCLNCELGCNGGAMTFHHDGSIDQAECWITRRGMEARQHYQEPSGETQARRAEDIEELIAGHWTPGLFHRTYTNRREHAILREPTPQQLDDVLARMHKHSDEDQYNCTSCGYNSCQKMALAIFNGLNKPANCHFYLAKENEIIQRELLEAQRRQAIADLRDREENLAVTLDSIGDAVIVTDRLGRITRMNPVAEEMTGWLRSEAEGRPLTEVFRIINSHTRTPAEDPVAKVIRTGKIEGLANHTALIARDGAEYQIADSAAPIRDADGAVYGVILVFHDVTEDYRMRENLRASEQKARAANIAKSHFLANMSHEIRTPMNGVIGMADLLLDMELDEQQRRYLQVIHTSGQALLTVINDILDFSKIEADKLELEMIDFDLRATVEGVGEALAYRAHEKHLEFICHIAPEVPTLLRGDPGRLRQILLNLGGNAVKFTAQGEVVIDVTLEPEAGAEPALRFAVRDTGIGIPAEKIDDLFSAFQQVDASHTRRFGGTGLGLAISKRLANLMGGEIGVTSTVGEGSVFWFTAVFGRQAAAPHQLPEAPAATLAGVRVLVVDDNATNRLLMREMLALWRVRHAEAEGGQQALLMLKEAHEAGDPFQIAILDMQMPGMDGETLGAAIKHDRALAGTLIIMLTSIGQRGDAHRLENIGFSAYLTKPLKKHDLYDGLVLLLDQQGRAGITRQHTPLITRHSLIEARRREANILLAEDNEVNKMVSLAILKQFGLTADCAENGLEVLRALEKRPYDLILMDVQMPVMDGLTAIRKIREIEQGHAPGQAAGETGFVFHPATPKHLPIIALTAYAMQGDRERCLDAGADDYLTKPVDRTQMLEKFESLLPGKFARAGTSPAAAPPPGKHEPCVLERHLADHVDVHTALSRLGGNGTMLLNLLGKLRTEFSHVADRLHQLLQSPAPSEAIPLIHAIRGAAGNLGAMRLMQASQHLEDALRQDLPGATDLANEFLKAGHELVAAMEHIEAGNPATAASPRAGEPALTPEQTAALLEELRSSLTKRQPKPCREIIRRLGTGRTPIDPALLDEMTALLARYQFAPALRIVKNIQAASGEPV